MCSNGPLHPVPNPVRYADRNHRISSSVGLNTQLDMVGRQLQLNSTMRGRKRVGVLPPCPVHLFVMCDLDTWDVFH
jgi:hypothetical protein